jgi:hypothetical protein
VNVALGQPRQNFPVPRINWESFALLFLVRYQWHEVVALKLGSGTRASNVSSCSDWLRQINFPGLRLNYTSHVRSESPRVWTLSISGILTTGKTQRFGNWRGGRHLL